MNLAHNGVGIAYYSYWDRIVIGLVKVKISWYVYLK